MIPIRKGIMLIGESGVGKTCCYKVLIEAINEICETSFQDEQKVDHFLYAFLFFIFRVLFDLIDRSTMKS